MDPIVEKVTQYPLDRVALGPNMEARLVDYVKETWRMGRKQMAPYTKAWAAHRLAWKAEHSQEVLRAPGQRSRSYLPWVYATCERWKAYQLSATWPNDLEVFELESRTKGAGEGVESYEEYIKYKMESGGFLRFYNDLLGDAVHGFGVGKIYWNYSDGPAGGVSFETINPDDFAFFPVDKSDLNETTRIHRSFTFYERLLSSHAALGDASPYRGLEKIKLSDENKSEDSGPAGEFKKEGLELKEAWVHRLKIKDDTGQEIVLSDVVITICNDKHLIRLTENPYANSKSPFITLSCVPDGAKAIGYGVCHHALPIQYAANVVHNAWIDSVKRSYAMYKYRDDGVFDPYTFVGQPGALIEVDDLNNLQPIVDASGEKMAEYQQTIEAFKIEFEEATISRQIKGALDEGGRTATETITANENASAVLGQQAKLINEKSLEPAIELVYLLVMTILQQEMEEYQATQDLGAIRVGLEMAKLVVEPFQEIEGQKVQLDDATLLAQLPEPLVLNELMVKMTGYQNVSQRLRAEQALTEGIPMLTETPMGNKIDWPEVTAMWGESKGLDIKRILLSKEDQARIDEQAAQEAQAQADAVSQQAEINNQVQLGLMQAQMDKNAKDFEAKLLEMELRFENEAMKLQLEAAKAGQAQLALEAKIKAGQAEAVQGEVSNAKQG